MCVAFDGESEIQFLLTGTEGTLLFSEGNIDIQGKYFLRVYKQN